MWKPLIFLALLFGLITPALAFQEGGWCYEKAKEDPKYPFRLVSSFTLELQSRKNTGIITEQDHDWAYGEIGKAIEALSKNEPKAGCLILEELEMEYNLLPREVDNAE